MKTYEIEQLEYNFSIETIMEESGLLKLSIGKIVADNFSKDSEDPEEKNLLTLVSKENKIFDSDNKYDTLSENEQEYLENSYVIMINNQICSVQTLIKQIINNTTTDNINKINKILFPINLIKDDFIKEIINNNEQIVEDCMLSPIYNSQHDMIAFRTSIDKISKTDEYKTSDTFRNEIFYSIENHMHIALYITSVMKLCSKLYNLEHCVTAELIAKIFMVSTIIDEKGSLRSLTIQEIEEILTNVKKNICISYFND